MNKARKNVVATLVLATLMAACSSQPETANNNTATTSPVAQNGTVPASSEASAPPAPAPAPVGGAKVETDSAQPKVSAAGQLVPSGPSPKLVVPATKIDFGKQPQS